LLRFLCAMLDRMQQFRIHTSHSCQIVCIDPVSFILVFVDHPQSSRIGNQNLMSQAFQESADPTGMGPRFQGDPHRFYVCEFALQGFGRRRNLSFFDHFSVAVQNHVVAFLVGQIQSNREITLLLVITLHLASLLSFCTKQCVFADHYRYCVKGGWPSHPYLCATVVRFLGGRAYRMPDRRDACRNVTGRILSYYLVLTRMITSASFADRDTFQSSEVFSEKSVASSSFRARTQKPV